MKIQTFFNIAIIYIIIITSQTKAQGTIVHVKSKILKIDSTKSFYIIDIGLKKDNGVFIISKACDNYLLKKIKIKKNVEYIFKLRYKPYNPNNSFLSKKDIIVEYADEKLVWSNKMKKTFYEECLNMCGLYIDNEGNSN
ncbi:hypothetical protein [Chryseobacterium vrystaatense]|uniref:DUF4369 domain-containing protein n=1 Tax=Chryseobacterium vrystaatense TaxID=307480 RepID=A0ABR4UFA0_9FLAO|nr:hypothetical protein [Chryseobacterium vrystaatense]KFF22678.1 hypothetical protein IW16_26750 [Chryseobacterium vrystaatense]